MSVPSHLPDVDVGSPPETDDPNEAYGWWSDAVEALREHMDDWIHAMVGSKTHVEPVYEEREVEKSNDREVHDPGVGVRLETETWTETERVLVGEKKVCEGHHIDVEVTSESEKHAVVALANSAGLKVRERGPSTRFTHRIERA